MLLNLWSTTCKNPYLWKKIGNTWKTEIICFKCNSPYQLNVNYQGYLAVWQAKPQLHKIWQLLIDHEVETMMSNNWITIKIRCRVYIKRSHWQKWTMMLCKIQCQQSLRTNRILFLHQNRSLMEWAILSTLHWMNWRDLLNTDIIKRVILRLKAKKDPRYKNFMKNKDLAQVTISIISR